MKKSLKYVQLNVRLTMPSGSECFGTEAEDGSDEPIRQPLATPERKDVVIQVLQKLAAALIDGKTSITVETNEDGYRIVRDETFPLSPPPAVSVVAPPKPAPAGGNEGTTTLIDLNKATKTKLCKLPGIGPATAARIIEHRPYKTVDELVVKIDIMDAESVNRIRSLVTVTSE
jgi:DNA uptake protein ComE-like DNA-binding protein